MPVPSWPVLFEPSPWRPRWAVCSGLKRKWTSVLCRSLDSMTMSPPLPPSPPEGPPRGTNFSRLNAMQPFPPSPALTRIFASSMNMLVVSRWQNPVFPSVPCGLSVFYCPTKDPEIKKPRPEGEAMWTDYVARALPSTSSGQALPAALTTKMLAHVHGFDHHEFAHLSLVQELDASRDLGEESV